MMDFLLLVVLSSIPLYVILLLRQKSKKSLKSVKQLLTDYYENLKKKMQSKQLMDQNMTLLMEGLKKLKKPFAYGVTASVGFVVPLLALFIITGLFIAPRIGSSGDVNSWFHWSFISNERATKYVPIPYNSTLEKSEEEFLVAQKKAAAIDDELESLQKSVDSLMVEVRRMKAFNDKAYDAVDASLKQLVVGIITFGLFLINHKNSVQVPQI